MNTEFYITTDETVYNVYIALCPIDEKHDGGGIYVKRGRYGDTYAHKDIAFEFVSAISPVFKLYLIKEFQRLKEEENDLQKLEWDAKRFLSKNNYLIQTDAVLVLYYSNPVSAIIMTESFSGDKNNDYLSMKQ